MMKSPVLKLSRKLTVYRNKTTETGQTLDLTYILSTDNHIDLLSHYVPYLVNKSPEKVKHA